MDDSNRMQDFTTRLDCVLSQAQSKLTLITTNVDDIKAAKIDQLREVLSSSLVGNLAGEAG